MATYYIANSGSDSNAGTSTGSPWKTPSKVALYSAATGFAAGDAILFKSGETHVPAASGENITFSQHRSKGSAIQISAYGTGDAPILLLDNAPLTSWSAYSGAMNVWYNSYAGSVCPVLWEDGVFLRPGDSIDGLRAGEYYWNSSSNAYYSLDSGKAVGVYVCPFEGVAADHVYQRNNTITGLSLSNRSHIWVRDVQIMAGYQGVFANATTAHHTNLRVMDCIIKECRSALQLDSTNGYNNIECAFLNNVIEDCGHGAGMENSTAGGGTEKSIGCTFKGNQVRKIHVLDKWSRVGAFLDKEGFFFMNPEGCSIEGNIFEGGGMAGGAIGLWTDDVTATFERTSIQGNVVKAIAGRVMHLGGANAANNGGVYAHGNFAIDCDADCAIKLNVTPGANGGTIVANTIVRCGDVTVWAQTNCDDWALTGNVFIRDSGLHVQLDSGASIVSSRNCWYGGTPPSLGSGDFTSDPLLDANYRPTALSPCRGAGIYIPGAKHFGGVPMNAGAPDIGAHRYFAAREIAADRTVRSSVEIATDRRVALAMAI